MDPNQRHYARANTQCTTLQHTATDCSRLQQTATDCNRLQQTATDCNTPQHTATHCNTQQHIATHCNTLQQTQTPHLIILINAREHNHMIPSHLRARHMECRKTPACMCVCVYVCVCVSESVPMCDMPHPFVRQDLFIFVTWLIHMESSHLRARLVEYANACVCVCACVYVRAYMCPWAMEVVHLGDMTH